MVRKLITITLVISTLPTFGTAGNYIARVNEDGDILFERDSGFSADVVEVEVSEIDGSIYVSFSTSSARLRKFNENGYYDSGFDLPAFGAVIDFDISIDDYLWVPGIEITDDNGLYKYTNSGGYVFGIEDFRPYGADTEGSTLVWAAVNEQAPVTMPGIHRFTSGGSRNLYLDDYRAGHISVYEAEGSLWFGTIESDPYHLEVIKIDSDGDEVVRLKTFDLPADFQCDQLDGSCWFFEYYTGDLYKVNTFGSIVFRDSSFSDIAAIDVNESDGSVWVASNIPKRLVHLDKDGNRMLYKEWPGGDFAHLAVDQRNGTCIVIYEEYRSGDMNIRPSSVGKIKAMYAD